jgi:WD40 repeat protein
MTSEDIPYVYHCWAHLKRTKYRSTMYVTAKGKRRTGISKDQQLSATQQQTLSPSLGASQKITANSQKVVSLMCRLEAGPRGCFTCKFSHSGKYLCCGCADWVMFPLKVFDVITGECIIAYSGHHDLIYEINWTLDDSQLLTASSDGTAKLWHFMNGNQTTDSYLTLQHTSFVYCAKFHPVEQLRLLLILIYETE